MTGQTKSGKTTRLMEWVASQKNIDGILQPTIEGKRFLYHIFSRSLIQLETDQTKNSIEAGKYKFRSDVFELANKKLIQCLNKNLDWIVIDEIGYLELNGKGFDTAVKVFLKNDFYTGKLIFVIRESLLKKVIQHYGLEQYELINHNFFSNY